MLKNPEIHIRDPFVLPIIDEKLYYLYGTTGQQAWTNSASGIDYYTSSDLQNWEVPFPAFRPPQGFWADRNFWAPEVHAFRGRYYMFASFKAEKVSGVERKFWQPIAHAALSYRLVMGQLHPAIGSALTEPYL